MPQRRPRRDVRQWRTLGWLWRCCCWCRRGGRRGGRTAQAALALNLHLNSLLAAMRKLLAHLLALIEGLLHLEPAPCKLQRLLRVLIVIHHHLTLSASAASSDRRPAQFSAASRQIRP